MIIEKIAVYGLCMLLIIELTLCMVFLAIEEDE